MHNFQRAKHKTAWQTTNFFNAARQSLIFCGDEATGWSMGWKLNLWARFLDGDHAHEHQLPQQLDHAAGF